MGRRIALLECDHVAPDLQHIAGDYGDMFVTRIAAADPDLEVVRVDAVGGEPLPTVGDHDGYVITGSRHSITDALPWLDGVRDLLVDAHAAEAPVVGICFGHQLIAQVFGGRVERAAAGWGVGVHEATLVEPRTWMDPPAERFRLLVSHQDQVTDLPPGATLLATSDHAPVAAFELGSLVGFQGHPEFVADYAAALLDRRVELIGAEVVDRARRSLGTATDHDTVTRWMLGAIAATWRRAGHTPPALPS